MNDKYDVSGAANSAQALEQWKAAVDSDLTDPEQQPIGNLGTSEPLVAPFTENENDHLAGMAHDIFARFPDEKSALFNQMRAESQKLILSTPAGGTISANRRKASSLSQEQRQHLANAVNEGMAGMLTLAYDASFPPQPVNAEPKNDAEKLFGTPAEHYARAVEAFRKKHSPEVAKDKVKKGFFEHLDAARALAKQVLTPH